MNIKITNKRETCGCVYNFDSFIDRSDRALQIQRSKSLFTLFYV